MLPNSEVSLSHNVGKKKPDKKGYVINICLGKIPKQATLNYGVRVQNSSYLSEEEGGDAFGKAMREMVSGCWKCFIS